MFNPDHERGASRNYLGTLKPGGFVEFMLLDVHPNETVPAARSPTGTPYDVTPMDVHVHRYTPTDKQTNTAGKPEVVDDVRRWDVPADKIGPIILLAKQAAHVHGDQKALCQYALRCDVVQKYNPISKRNFFVYDFRAVDVSGAVMPEGQLPGQTSQRPPDEMDRARGVIADARKAVDGVAAAMGNNANLGALDVFASDLHNVRSIADLVAAWNRHSAALTAAGAVAEAQDMAGKVKQGILLAEVKAFATAADLQAAEPQLLKVAGPKLAGVVGDAIKRQLAAMPAAEDDIPF